MLPRRKKHEEERAGSLAGARTLFPPPPTHSLLQNMEDFFVEELQEFQALRRGVFELLLDFLVVVRELDLRGAQPADLDRRTFSLPRR